MNTIFQKKLFSSRNPRILSQMLINGKFVNSVSGKTFKVVNPATEQIIANIQEADKADADIAVKAAKEAFENGPWRRLSSSDRGKLIYKLADLIEKNREELSYLESLDNGKPAHIANLADLELTIGTFRYYAGWCDKIQGKTIPINGPYFCYTRHEPVGVCAQIIPWNFPLLMAAWKLGPALAMGCTSVLKPAEQTPLTALRLGELMMEAGLPNGVVNILPGYGPTVGHALATHKLVDKVAFTGSTEIGLEIMKNCHVNGLKRVTLELGGKSPLIVLDDADIDFAVQQSSEGIFFNMGQCCVASSRVFVHERIYDKFIAKSVEAAKRRVVGNPLEHSTDQGPLVDLDQKNKYLHYINKGKEQGAKLEYGGKLREGRGYFVEPTVFSDVTDDMAIAKEEIFGPVKSILKFSTIDEVVKRANSTTYGLGAGIITNNIENALKISNALRAGTVWINCYNKFDCNSPFGGYKNSGIGREMGEYGLQNYTEVKTVIIKRPDDSLP